MASRSGVRVVLRAEAFPALPGALEVVRAGEKTAGDRRNRDFAGAHVEVAENVPEERVTLGYDPQTAGGLLVALPRDRAVTLEGELRARDLFVARVGHVEDGAGVSVV